MASTLIGSKLATTSSTLLFAGAPRILALRVKARASNTNNLYVSDNEAAKETGFELTPGSSENLVPYPLRIESSEVYLYGDGGRLDYVAIMER